MIPSKSVSATDPVVSTQVLASTEARYLNESVMASLPETVEVNSNDLVSLVSKPNTTANNTVKELQIVSVKPTHTEITNIAAYDVGEDGSFVQVNVPYTTTAARTSISGIVTDYRSKYDITMNTTVYYETSGSAADLNLRPYAATFSYSYVSGATSTITFNKLIFKFRAKGDLYYGSSFESDNYEFSIAATWTNLVADRSYTATSEMPTGYWLQTSFPEYGGCFSADYTCTINGVANATFNRPIP